MRGMREPHLDITPWIRRLEGKGVLALAERRALERALSSVHRFGPDEVLVSMDDSVEYAVLVLSGLVGRVQFTRREERRISSVLVPGDICSCGLALAQPMDYSLVALGHGKCARITAANLRVLQETAPQLMLPIGRSLVEEAVVGRAWLVNAAVRSGRARVAHLLSELHWRLAAVGLADGNGCDVQMMQRDIAAAVGLSIVQVNRVLQQLRNDGLVALARGGLEVTDAAGLRSIGSFEPSYLEVRLRPADSLAWRGVMLH